MNTITVIWMDGQQETYCTDVLPFVADGVLRIVCGRREQVSIPVVTVRTWKAER